MSWPLDDLPDMAWHLRQLLGQVPRGRVTTYGALAAALGDPVAARWVGQFLLHHRHDAACPCHRVVRGDGSLGQYIEGDLSAKAARLAAEAVEVCNEAVDLHQFGFDRFVGQRPLERLSELQDAIESRVCLRGPRRMPSFIAGLDVSYPSEDFGVGAYALVQTATGRLLWSTSLKRRIRFPYISSYLSFREIPIHLALIEAARAAGRMADVLIVDGSGILHPRGVGIASHLGVVAAVPTIGVTKKLLCGEVDLECLGPLKSRPVVHQGRIAGVAIRPTPGSRRPLFISPGHWISLSQSERVVRKALCGHRLPEPLFWADRFSRTAGPGPR